MDGKTLASCQRRQNKVNCSHLPTHCLSWVSIYCPVAPAGSYALSEVKGLILVTIKFGSSFDQVAYMHK
jgi:hypothetical protein